FAAEKSNLILTARRLDRLEILRKELLNEDPNLKIHVAYLDVTRREEVFKLVQQLPTEFKNIDILVNNAGLVVGLEPLAECRPEDMDVILDTNVKGLVHVTQSILPGMLHRKAGHIINVGSVAGLQAYANGSLYCASKYAVNAISKALTQELVNTPLKVTHVAPGHVETEFSMVRFRGDEQKAKAVYQGMQPLVADDIAEIIIFAASRPPHVQINDVLVFPTSQASPFHVHRT
ncbi:hypothetical protein HMI56_000469, partial [Coelomomyces lativittatus]